LTSELKYFNTTSLDINTTMAPAIKKATIKEAIVDGSNHADRKSSASRLSCQMRSTTCLLLLIRFKLGDEVINTHHHLNRGFSYSATFAKN
jgi:hypothetical protein